MKTFRIFFCLVLVCMGFSMCKSSEKAAIQQKPEVVNISETKWKMVSYRGKEPKSADAESQITILINEEAKTVSGYSSCNHYFGTIVVFENGKIKLEKVGSTKRACPQANMHVESNYLSSLEKITDYEISKTELKLLQHEKVLYVFEKE